MNIESSSIDLKTNEYLKNRGTDDSRNSSVNRKQNRTILLSCFSYFVRNLDNIKDKSSLHILCVQYVSSTYNKKRVADYIYKCQLFWYKHN